MKKSTIITIIAFVLGILLLSTGFVLLTDNAISEKFFAKFSKPEEEEPPLEAMDFFKIDVSQYVTLGQYKGLKVEVEQTEITREEVEAQIDIYLCQLKKVNKIESGVIGEKVYFSFNYKGYLLNEDGTKGEAFSGGSAEDQLAYIEGNDFNVIYSSQVSGFIDGFAQGIINKNVGDTFDLPITFPENYSPELAGKKTVFEIKINYIAEPAFTDEWVKEYTKNECETREEFIEQVINSANDEIKATNLQTAWSKIVEGSTFIEIPKQQFNYLYKENYEYYKGIVDEYVMYSPYYFGAQLDFDQVLVKLGFKNQTEFEDYVKELTNEAIKTDLVFFAVMQKENLQITDEEYRVLLEELVTISGKTEAEVLTQYGGAEKIKQSMLVDKVDKLIAKETEFVIKEK